ncbi:MAG: small basic family protein [Clostridia bacterium]|jgi:small basic protein
MLFIAILIGCVLGAIVGINAPIISYSYSSYLAIAIIAALDSVFGGIAGTLKGEFNFKVFISGFFCNSILSMLLTYLGNKLNVDIYLAAIVVFVGRMFINLTIIRKYYIDKWSKKYEEYKLNKTNKTQEEQK